MRETYSYLPKSFSEEELRAGFIFALGEAKKFNKKLTIFVNSIAHCSQFVSNIFNTTEFNKLRSNKSIKNDGISVSLESETTIRSYDSYEVILAIHASPRLLEKIDQNKSVKSLVLLAEKNDVSEEWLTNVKAKSLATS